MSALFNRRVIVAAAKLAAFYAGLVVLEFVVLEFAFGGVVTYDEVVSMATALSIPFAFAFLLLALARRWGFVAFWTILGALWVLLATASRAWIWPTQYPKGFLAWSIFALPLWLIGQAGIPRSSKHRISGSMLLLLCWAILLFGVPFYANNSNFEFVRPHQIGILDRLAWIWAPMPLILSAFAIRHVWRGTAKPIAA